MTSPSLPACYRWAADPDNAEKQIAHGTMALPHPGDPDRASRWARVLRWYAPGAQPHNTPTPDQNGEQFVVSVGADAAAVGRAAAQLLRRQYRHVATIAAAQEAPSPRGGSILLTASTAACTLAALTSLEQHWRVTGTRWGLLTGRDPAGMFFSLAKIVAARHSTHSPTRDVLVDGPRTHARLLSPGFASSHQRLADAVAGDWRLMVIDAHGSGGHALAAPYVFCGLSTDTERGIDGTVITNGCAPGRCKMAPDNVLIPQAVRDLRARLLALFVCNGITLGIGEQYPSDVSLALAALEGYPAATFGLLRQDVDTEDAEPAAATTLIHAGWTLGHTTASLADAAATRGVTTAYALLGDPDWSPLPPPARRHTHTAAPPETGFPNEPLTTADTHRRSSPLAIQGVRSTPDPRTAGLGHPGDQLTNTMADLHAWFDNLTAAAALECSIADLAHAQPRGDEVIDSGIEQMRHARRAAHRLVLHALRHTQARRSADDDLPPGHSEELASHANQWALAVARTATDSRTLLFNRLAQRLHEYHDPTRRTVASACPYCATPRTRLLFTSAAGIPDRIAVSCPRCGPQAEHPHPGHAIQARLPRTVRPGQTTLVTIDLDGPDDSYHRRTGVLLTQLRPRSSRRGPLHVDIRETPAPSRVAVPMQVPEDLDAELHRLWVLFAHRFQISVAQTRTACLP